MLTAQICSMKGVVFDWMIIQNYCSTHTYIGHAQQKHNNYTTFSLKFDRIILPFIQFKLKKGIDNVYACVSLFTGKSRFKICLNQ